MSNKKIRQGVLPAILSAVSLYLFFGILLTFFLLTKYVPYLLTAVTVLSPALILTSLILFRHPLTLKERKVREESPRRIVRILRKTGAFFCAIGRLFKKLYNGYRLLIKVFVIIALFVGVQALFLIAFKQIGQTTVALWQPIVLVAFIILTVILDKWCKHADREEGFTDGFLKSLRAYFRVIYAVITVCAVSSTLLALSVWDMTLYIKYVIAVIFYYMTVFEVVSIVITGLRSELDSYPRTVMPIRFVKGTGDDVSVIDFLENNTGITMRGLWSMRYVKQIAPVTLVIVAGFLWLSTCIVQVNPDSKAAVYRLGVLQDNILGPGIHLILPYPFDKVSTYNTEQVNRLTVGYDSAEETDNIWTGGHGSNEYKLLLGGGDELVSINLRLEYKIKDLREYLTSTSSPESFLEAQAYELVTDRTIDTDLATLLSADRDAFAKSFGIELTKKINRYNTGIEIVSVILESIHPPLEIAAIYQNIISAQITAEKTVIDAQSIAEMAIAKAEQTRDTAISEATAEQSTKIAAAKTSVAEFTAGVDAYNSYPSAYTYYKYLKAVGEAYKKANLVIVGDGIDSSKLYFGSFNAEKETKNESN